MTAFTPNTGATVRWDSLSGGSTNATLDTYTISNGTTLLIDVDSYQCANHTTAFGSVDTISFTGTGGKLKIDGTNIRVIPYNTGTGNVPAIGTSIVQGGVSGTLTGVWANWLSEPVAAGNAMPVTGFIKVISKTGGDYAAGALTNIGASATGADVVGWIEVRGADTAQITVPRIGTFEVTGDYFELGTTSGSRGQVLACPTTATVAGVFPGVQIETGVGTGVYEWYASVGSLAAASTIPTDATRGKVIWQTTSGIRIGSDGTNNVGYLPPSGCRVRIPNVILTCCTRTVSGSGPRVLPNTTLATRQEYVTTGAGTISISKCVHQWYGQWAQPYQVTLLDSAFNDAVNISEQAAALNVQRCCVSPTQLQINVALNMASNFAGGTIQDNVFNRISLASSGSYTATTNYVVGVNFVSNKLVSFTNRANATTGIWSVTQSLNCNWTTNTVIGGRILHTGSVNPIHTNTAYVDGFTGTTGTGNPMSVVELTAASSGGVIDGITLPVTNNHPYTALVTTTASYNGVIKNIGSYASKLTLGSANQTGVIVNSGGNNSGVKVKRCFTTNTRTGLFAFINSDDNILCENVYGDYADTTNMVGLNMQMKGCGVTPATTGQTSVYGSHWIDCFTSTTTGRIVIQCNEPTALSASQCAVTVGTPQWNSSGSLLATVLGQQVTWEMNYFAIGLTALQNTAPTLTGTNTGNLTYEFQYDKTGGGYNGTWLTLNAANLSGVGAITPSVGIKLKIRATVAVAATTNVLTQIRIDTTTTDSDQGANAYPISTGTVAVTGLITGSRVKAEKVSDGTVLFNGVETANAVSFSTDQIVPLKITARKSSAAPFYQEWITQLTPVADGTVSAVALQVTD
jgi:hypothetical protein